MPCWLLCCMKKSDFWVINVSATDIITLFILFPSVMNTFSNDMKIVIYGHDMFE